ncbi:MAG: helix-turn-helix transcriptional regulator, partial [Gammaproteobacteria bacterium]|nr:helix-turn-helix transcriptional regulator [Gammaproteobacteria bacterium]
MKPNHSTPEAAVSSLNISLADYDQLVLAIHGGSYDDQTITTALDCMRKHFKANFVTLILRIPGVEDVGLMLVSGDLAVHGQLAYISYYRSLTPFSGQSIDTVFTQRDVMTDEEWVKTDYYQTSCKYQNVFHVMGADISTEHDGVFRLRITRAESEPAFDEQDRALCQMLLPHIRSAFYVRSMLGRSESMGNLYADAINRLSVATILLNDKGVVQKLNDYAQTLLERSDGLKLVGDRLEASYPSDNKELQKRIKDAFDARERREPISSEPLSVTRPSGEVNLGIVFETVPDT